MREENSGQQDRPPVKNRLVALGLIKEKGPAQARALVKVTRGEEIKEGSTRGGSGGIPEEGTRGDNKGEKKKRDPWIERLLGEVAEREGCEVVTLAPKRMRGRPRVEQYNFKKLTVMLPLKYAEFIQWATLPEILTDKNRPGRTKLKEGAGGRMRKIIDHYLVYARREKEQMKTLVHLIMEMEKDLKVFLESYQKLQVDDEWTQAEESICKKMGHFEFIRNLLKMEIGEVAQLLTKEQRKNWEILQMILSRKEVHGGGEELSL